MAGDVGNSSERSPKVHNRLKPHNLTAAKLRWGPMRRLTVFAAVVLVLEAITFLARLERNVTPFVLVLIPAAAALGVSAVVGGWPEVRRLVARIGTWRVGARW